MLFFLEVPEARGTVAFDSMEKSFAVTMIRRAVSLVTAKSVLNSQYLRVQDAFFATGFLHSVIFARIKAFSLSLLPGVF